MKKIAIIPARGGSKRIPRKNIQLFMGKPILAYSIEIALQSGLFDEIMLSTDDKELADIALQYGAKVPFMRSAENANDFAGLAQVVEEVLDNYKNKGVTFDFVCCILPTAPLLQVEDLIQSYYQLVDSEFTSLCSVVAFSYPILRSLTVSDNKKVEMCFPEYKNARSQDMPTFYHDAGAFYWSSVDAFYQHKRFLSSNCMAYIINEIKTQDIDNDSDWKLAELKYQLLKSN